MIATTIKSSSSEKPFLFFLISVSMDPPLFVAKWTTLRTKQINRPLQVRSHLTIGQVFTNRRICAGIQVFLFADLKTPRAPTNVVSIPRITRLVRIENRKGKKLQGK